jgi:hypothetical protein
MKKIFILGILLAGLISVPILRADDFHNLWYDGNAEISVYDLKENRYDQIRTGRRIMVYVTEPLRRDTLIKPDSPLPQKDRYDVLKLNDIRKFKTGLYDYSVMTSVFCNVNTQVGLPDMNALKISFSSQEWCGNVFEVIKQNPKDIHVKLFSYFESDGEPETVFKTSNDLLLEDNLWVMIRELKKPFIKNNTHQTFRLIPSSWQRRKHHESITISTVTILKTNGGIVTTPAGRFECTRFEWNYGKKTTTAMVERAWPRKIITWTEPDGSSGTLISSTRKPYWTLHGNNDAPLRRDLRIEQTD